MGILGKITGHDEKKQEDERIADAVCPHTSLTQRWANADDIGKKDLATYVCDACGESFSYDEARTILEPTEHTPNLPVS